MRFLQLIVLFNLILAGAAMYIAIPVPHIQKCLVFQYDIMNMQATIDKRLQPAILSTEREICIDINKGE